jgi:ABC-2 type transport system permease protein
LAVASLTIRQVIAYRADFWVNFIFYSLCQLAMSYFVWKSIYQIKGEEMIGSRNFSQMVFYTLATPMLARVLYGLPIFHTAREIYSGELNKYLVYPINYFLYRFTVHYIHCLFYFLQMLLALGLYHFFIGFPPNLNLNFFTLLGVFLFMHFSLILYFLLNSCIEQVAFWADNVWSLIIAHRMVIVLAGGVLIPIDLFPEWSLTFIHWLPYQAMIAYPIQILEGNITMDLLLLGVGQMLLWIGVALIINTLIWRRGNLQYTGVGI